MALRSTWKGFIKLSLVSVPVKAFTATATGNDIRLNQLHAECHNRIKYKKECPEHGEVSNDEIIKGYEYAKGQYVVIEDDELDKLRTKSDRSVQIDGFFEANSLDPIFHAGRTYYLLPDGAVGQKPYALLREGMRENSVQGMARVVMSGKEQLVLLRVMEDLLVLTVLMDTDKVKSADLFKDELKEEKIAKDELNLTNTLVQASTMKDFDFGAYKDEYTARLTDLIQRKVDGEEIVQVPDPEEPKIINLMDALKKSVAEAQGIDPSDIQDQASQVDQSKPHSKKKSTKKKASKKSASG